MSSIEQQNSNIPQSIIKAAELNDATNTQKVKNLIYLKENPSPIIIIGITALYISILYVIYLLIVSSTLDGIWYDNHGNEIDIKQNVLSDNFTYLFKGKLSKGYIKNNVVYLLDNLNKKKGILFTHKNTIKWNDSSNNKNTWNRQLIRD